MERFFKYDVKNWVVYPIFIAATAIKPPELMAVEIGLLTSDVIDFVAAVTLARLHSMPVP